MISYYSFLCLMFTTFRGIVQCSISLMEWHLPFPCYIPCSSVPSVIRFSVVYEFVREKGPEAIVWLHKRDTEGDNVMEKFTRSETSWFVLFPRYFSCDRIEDRWDDGACTCRENWRNVHDAQPEGNGLFMRHSAKWSDESKIHLKMLCDGVNWTCDSG